MYQVVKRYGHEEGLSTAFRQWRAKDSHCHFLHGYSLAFELTFNCYDLDYRNWCLDFGSLKEVKQYLKDNFDHKTVIALDDPELEWFLEGNKRSVLDLRVVDHVGLEKFAGQVYSWVSTWLLEKEGFRVWLESVKVQEHSGNSVMYFSEYNDEGVLR